jgi:hypothetical protein
LWYRSCQGDVNGRGKVLEREKVDLVAEETAGYVDLFAPNDDDLLAGEDLFGDDGGETAEEVAFAVDDDRC